MIESFCRLLRTAPRYSASKVTLTGIIPSSRCLTYSTLRCIRMAMVFRQIPSFARLAQSVAPLSFFTLFLGWFIIIQFGNSIRIARGIRAICRDSPVCAERKSHSKGRFLKKSCGRSLPSVQGLSPLYTSLSDFTFVERSATGWTARLDSLGSMCV